MATPIWPIEGIALDSTGEMVANSLADKISDLLLISASRSYVYPTLAAGATVVSANTDWVLGAFAQIVPASTIGTDFNIRAISISSCDRDAVFEIVLYAGAGNDEIGRHRFAIEGGFFGNIQIPMITEIVAADSRIQAKLASSNGTALVATITMSITYVLDA